MDYKLPDCLYNLLPAVYRIRDAKQGYPLRAFLRLIASQVSIVQEDIDRLWDNFFIETCADWVVPYIGDLVANNPLHDVVRSNRADVAKTIYYRRRKGTLPMLEEVARDITGWECHAVEFFELLDWTQNVNHLRYREAPNPEKHYPWPMDRVGTVNLRNLDALDHLDGPVDIISHTVDVRAIDQVEGWYNIKNIGFFLWRLRSYRLKEGVARPLNGSGDHRYHFSSLGNPIPLFHYPLREGDEAGLAREIHVPTPIRPIAFYNDLKSVATTYYGVGKSLVISKDGTVVPPTDIICKNLKNWDPVPADKVGVDVVRGRILFGADEQPNDPAKVGVSYHYGFSADIGGGPYDRHKTLITGDENTWQVVVAKEKPDPEPAVWKTTLQDVINEWNPDEYNRAVITIKDNGTYTEWITIKLSDEQGLVIQAGDGKRPTIRFVDDQNNLADLTIAGGNGTNATFVMNGLLIEGSIHVENNSLGQLELIHCTLVPGRALDENGNPVHPNSPSMQAAETNTSLEIEIDSSIVGLLRLPQEMPRLTLRDSILDGLDTAAIARVTTDDEAGPPTVLERTAVLGRVFVKELVLANEVILTGDVAAERTQNGCVRFSYITRESQTPRRFRCQPDLALAERAKQLKLGSVADLPADEEGLVLERVQPDFTSVHYGDPAYCQLSYHCPEEIRTGAEDGSEMGAFCHLKQPQRETNLRIRLEEYLPFGLKPGLIYVT